LAVAMAALGLTQHATHKAADEPLSAWPGRNRVTLPSRQARGLLSTGKPCA
jgi:hypothetical protein